MRRLRHFIARLLAPAPRPSARPLPYTRLTLAEWRSSPVRVNYAQSLLSDPSFLELIGMLANVRPAAPTPTDAISAATLLGQRIGHDQIIATLLAAATSPPAPPAEIEADYGAALTMRAWEGEENA